MNNLSISMRLGIGFGVILGSVAIMVLTTYSAFSRLGDHGRTTDSVAHEVLPLAFLAEEIAFNVVQVQQFLTDVSATWNTAGFAEAEA
ncbi:MAG: methyl-accepting chemotaxis protein, partial [bacterium]|nr:methyl-accepting chemotaxis protein [bacterium]